MNVNIFRKALILKGGYPTGAGSPPSAQSILHMDSGVPKFRVSDGTDLVPVPADQVMAAPTVVVANTGTPDGVATITITAKNGLGATLAARCLVRVFLSATAYGAPTDLGTLTATTGTLLKEDTDDALATVLTDATGVAVLSLDTAADGTVHAMASVIGVFGTDSEAITGNA